MCSNIPSFAERNRQFSECWLNVERPPDLQRGLKHEQTGSDGLTRALDGSRAFRIEGGMAAFEAKSRALGDNQSWHEGGALGASVPQLLSQSAISCPIR